MRTSWNKKVSKKVCSLVTSGRMAKEVSPTSPRVTLFKASVFTGSPSLGATAENVRKVLLSMEPSRSRRVLTWNQSSISERVHCPNIWSPIGMAQPPGEWEESILELQQLTPLRKGTESNREHTNHTHPKLENVSETRAEYRSRIQTVGAQEVDEVCEGKVEIDMFHAQQDCEQDPTVEKSRLLAGQDN
jgi:hypothetical protein